MALPVPFSPAFVALLLAVPAVYWLGRAVAHAVTADRGLRAVLPAGVALSAWLLAVHVASLAAGSLRVGLPAATLLVAAAGVAAERWRRLRAPPPEGRAPSPWMILGAALATAVIAALALRFDIHDELYVAGHMSFTAEMQNGYYPPRHPSFPDVPLRYHYGFDLLAASLTALLHLSVERAIDVAALGLWALAFCLLWALGERLVGRRHAWVTAWLGLFGGGLPFGCEGAAGANVLQACRIGEHEVTPPIVSFWFQHPWSLGIPVAITAVLVFAERRPPSAAARLAVLAMLLAVLSLSQIVLFTGMVPALVVAEACFEDRLELRRVPAMLAVAGVAVVAGRAMGGFFTRAPYLAPLSFSFHPGFGDTPRETALWNLYSFGLLVPLGALGLFRLRRARVLLLLLAGGALFTVNGLRYGYSVDIVKFGVLAMIALAIAASAAIAAVLPGRAPGSGGSRRAALRSALGLSLLGGATFWGVLYPLYFTLDLAEIPAHWRTQPDVLGPDDVRAVVLLRALARPGEMVYRAGSASHGYAQWGGLPQPVINWSTRTFGFPEARITVRERLLASVPIDPEPWRQQGFRWFVLAPGTEDAFVRRDAAAWIGAGQAREVARFGPLQVVELLPRAP